MKAVRTAAPGGWDQTQLVELDEPAARPGEALVALRACGLNPADYFQIEGKYPGGPNPPFVPGRDGAGTVAVGDLAARWKPGDRVVVLQNSQTDLANGTLCERQRFGADQLASFPPSWTFEQAAAAPLVYLTAWRALVVRGHLQPGQTVLVTGASGGVGTAAVQLARGLGAVVVALSRSAEKRQRLAQLGTHHVFAPDAATLKDDLAKATGKKGIDLVVETVGGPSLANSVHWLGPRGRINVVGLLAGVEGTVPIPSLLFKRATIEGILVSDFTPAEAQAAWLRILGVLEVMRAQPIVDSTYTLPDFRSAFQRLRQSPFGKVVVTL